MDAFFEPKNIKYLSSRQPDIDNAQDVIELAIQDQAAGLQPADVFELAPEYVRNDVAQVPKNMIKV